MKSSKLHNRFGKTYNVGQIALGPINSFGHALTLAIEEATKDPEIPKKEEDRVFARHKCQFQKVDPEKDALALKCVRMHMFEGHSILNVSIKTGVNPTTINNWLTGVCKPYVLRQVEKEYRARFKTK
jgi:hypothetical protein